MHKGGSYLKKFLVLLNIFAAAGLLLAYSAGYIPPSRLWLLAFFGLAYPVLLIINLAFIFLWLVSWKKIILLSLLTVGLGWNSIRTIYPFRLGNPKPASGISLKTVSYNVHSLYGSQWREHSPDAKSKVTEFLVQQKADIICIQEFFAMGEDYSQTLMKFTRSIQLDYYFFKNYQEFYNKQKINAIATFSRYPIVNTGSFKMADHSLFAIFSDIVLNRDTIRIYNVHLESIRFGEEDYAFYSNLTEPDKEVIPIKKGSLHMINKLRKAFVLRSSEVDILEKHIEHCPYPVILAGDFNDTPSSYSYHQLTAHLTDSYVAAGIGIFESTYAGKFPSFRIDYILYSGKLGASVYHKFDVDYSDHYPVTATVMLHP
ncbi:MAG: endonuclease/exonuclease/phosphatase family protein [Bacteroidota bacterium]